MGMKKKILYGMLWNLIDKGRRDPRWVKKVAAVGLMSGLFFMVSFGFLLYYAVGWAKDLVAGTPDMDLLALDRLITEKSIVLTEAQRQQLAPILEGLAAPGLAPEQTHALKTRLFDMIDPGQAATIEAWKTAAKTKATGLFALPRGVSTIIEEYTGASREAIVARIDAFLAWWQLTKPTISVEQLQKTIQRL